VICYVNNIRLKTKNAKLVLYFLNSIEFKNIKIKTDNNFKVTDYQLNIWNKKYLDYFSNLQKLDNYNGYELSYFYKLNKSNFNYNDNNYSKLINIFYISKNNKLSSTIHTNILERNVLENHIRNIDSRKLNNKLTIPYYFFTYRYNERYMPSQVKHWTSSVYNFLKSEKVGSSYKDIYTSKLLKSFFYIKSGRRKFSLKSNVLNALRIKVNSFLMDKVNHMIRYTSNRTRLAVRKLTFFPSQILTLDWAIKQISHTLVFKEFYNISKTNYKAGFYPKKKDYLKKFKKILISKPLFKHTSFNLVIDLFIYNNKRYIFRRMSNMVIRRTIYKYMYSMYINYYDKINDTINRPRYFYMNLIEPKLHKYYDLVVKYYGELIIKKKKPMLLLLYLFLLQVNFVNKNKLTSSVSRQDIDGTIKKLVHDSSHYMNVEGRKTERVNKNIDNNISDENKNMKFNQNVNSILLIKNEKKYSVIFKRRNINKKLNKYNYLLLKENKELYNLNKEIKRDKEIDSDKIISKSRKNTIKNNRFNFIKYKNYLIDLERKSNSPVDINSLSLWNSKGLGKRYRTPRGAIDESIGFKKKKNSFNFSYYYNNKKNWINYNDNNVLSDYKSSKKNSDIWYKRRNKLIPFLSSINNLNKKLNKNNNNNLLSDKNSILNSANNNLISKVRDGNNIELKKNENYSIINSLNKEQYIYEIKKEIKNNTLLNNLFTSFYIKNSNLSLNKSNNIKLFLHFDNPKKINQNKSGINLIKKDKLLFNAKFSNHINRVDTNINTKNFQHLWTDTEINSKILWDRLDHSILSTISKYIQINKDLSFGSNIVQINSLLNEIKRFKGFGNVWYLMYFISVIKKEFYIVNRDILHTKNINVRPYWMKIKNNTFISVNNNVFNFKHKNHTLKLPIWYSFLPNQRENNLNIKWGYYDKIFKPYYRNMISLFILNTYSIFIRHIGNYNPISYFFYNWINKFNNIRHNNIAIYNFLTVKILLDLLHYNYRSWIRIKSKYYYLRKVKIYRRKLHKLTINNWAISIRFFKKLKKTPKNFWLRYHKNAANYVERIIQNSELNTKRKIFVPFVLYIEDILFSIYGKWVIIRLWPLKYYYLSSYMLAKRILMLLLWRQKQKKRQRSNFTLSRYSLRLIEAFRSLEIKKAYSYYIYNASPWSSHLLLRMNNMNKPHSLNYKNLEFFNNKEERYHYLNSYTLMHNNLSDFIPIFNYRYISIVKNYINYINSFSWERVNLNNRYNYIYYWLLPLRNYIMELTKNTDITGIKFNLSGRPSWKRSNNRKVNKIYDHGNRLTPRHLNSKTYKSYSLYTPRLRGYLKSHTESSISISKSRSGSVSLKVWISSTLSVDVHELLLHLVRIKELYYQLINRYYLINKYLFVPQKKWNKPIKKWKILKGIKKHKLI